MFEDSDLVRAPRFALGISEAECWKCKSPTRVACIAVGAGYELVDEDDVSIEDDASVLTSVVSVNSDALQAVSSLAPWMTWIESKTAGASYFGNACQHCGALQGDHFLHSEPGGAFWPETKLDLAKIKVHWFDVPITAEALGLSWGVSWLGEGASRRESS